MQLQQVVFDNPKLRGVLRITELLQKQWQRGAAHSLPSAISTGPGLKWAEKSHSLTIPPRVYKAAGWTNSWCKHRVLSRSSSRLALHKQKLTWSSARELLKVVILLPVQLPHSNHMRIWPVLFDTELMEQSRGLLKDGIVVPMGIKKVWHFPRWDFQS